MTKAYGRVLVDGVVHKAYRSAEGRVIIGERELSAEEVTFLPPCQPSKIVCVGWNYVEHADELKDLSVKLPAEPLLFLKPPSALIGHGGRICRPPGCTQLDYEAELAVVIGKRAQAVKKRDAFEVIEGYTAFNDVTARNFQRPDTQWTRAKAFDTSAPLGPWIVPGLDVSDLEIRSLLNDEVRQRSSTKNMIFDVPTLIEYITNFMTLEPGDVIATGTPKGVGSMQEGDYIEVKIEGIGTLGNRVVNTTVDGR